MTNIEQPIVQKTRSSNIELFRILLMLSIVAHHYVVNSGLFDVIYNPPYTWRHYFLYLLGMWGKIGINCYVLITGYYMCKSQISVRKFVKLFLEVLFYNAVCYTIFTSTGYVPFSWRGMFAAINPISSITNGFTSCFLIYYLLIPFLNAGVQHITKKQHLLLIAICTFVFSVMIYLPRYEITYSYVAWFSVLHLISSYIRFYQPEHWRFSGKGIRIIAVGVGLAMLSVIFQLLLGQPTTYAWQYRYVMDSNAIIAVVSSILIFLGMKEIQIKQSKWINTIATTTLGVLLIHANSDAMRQWLWQDVCQNVEWFSSIYMPLHAIGCVMVVYVVCVIIDLLRMRIIEAPVMKLVDKWLAKYGIK